MLYEVITQLRFTPKIEFRYDHTQNKAYNVDKIINNIDGFLFFNKELNITSFQAINKIKRELNLSKIGHAGTLDKQQ